MEISPRALAGLVSLVVNCGVSRTTQLPTVRRPGLSPATFSRKGRRNLDFEGFEAIDFSIGPRWATLGDMFPGNGVNSPA
jgi:hypothetical protein